MDRSSGRQTGQAKAITYLSARGTDDYNEVRHDCKSVKGALTIVCLGKESPDGLRDLSIQFHLRLNISAPPAK